MPGNDGIMFGSAGCRGRWCRPAAGPDWCRRSSRSTCGVYSGSGPSSMVSAIALEASRM
jgi:hypothetical protein